MDFNDREELGLVSEEYKSGSIIAIDRFRPSLNLEPPATIDLAESAISTSGAIAKLFLIAGVDTPL